MMEQKQKMVFIHCEHCGKRLIVKKPSGELQFVFGKSKDFGSPIEMTISGIVKIRCLRKKCRRWNIVKSVDESMESTKSTESKP